MATKYCDKPTEMYCVLDIDQLKAMVKYVKATNTKTHVKIGAATIVVRMNVSDSYPDQLQLTDEFRKEVSA